MRANPFTGSEAAEAVDAAMRGRRSVRAFSPAPVSRTIVAEILELAACAPSGTNTQPWHVVALAGAIGAMVLQRYVIVVSTAFGGAWTLIVGAVNVLATRGITKGASPTEVWILYPNVPGERWAPIAWMWRGPSPPVCSGSRERVA